MKYLSIDYYLDTTSMDITWSDYNTACVFHDKAKAEAAAMKSGGVTVKDASGMFLVCEA